MPDRTIIVATDGSDHSLRVLPHADCLAKAVDATIELVRVVEMDDIAGDHGDQSAAIQNARSRIESQMEADLRYFGIQAEKRVIIAPEGEDPASTLMSVASRGLILAMHSRGRSGIVRFLRGSVALAVMKRVDQPVLLGGPELLPPPAGTDTFRLLVTTDLSPAADYVLRGVAPLLELGKFDVTLLYVHLHTPQGIDNEAEKAKRLAELNQKRSLLPPSVPVDVVVREIPIGGGVDTAIIEAGEETGAQAIAMATHGYSAKYHLLMGSTALSILGRSRLPLIVLRAEA